MHTFLTRRELARWFPKGGTGAEIGVENGNYAQVLLEEAKPELLWLIDCWHQQSGLYDLDPCNVSEERKEQQLAGVRQRFACNPEVRIIREFSPQAAEFFDNETMDWVYIDAAHYYEAVSADLRAWWDKLKPGGILAGHDYFERPDVSWVAVKRAVDDFCKDKCCELAATTNDRYPSWAIVKP